MLRIAIPEPTTSDADYNSRSLPPYLDALRASGAEPVIVKVNAPQADVARLLAGVQGILLPGSRYDVDPQRYGATRIPECGEPDPGRAAVDELFLQDAFNLRKPVLAICHGTQTLNVWRNGTLIQDLKTEVNHRPGREVVEAHPVRVAAGSRLAALLPCSEAEAAFSEAAFSEAAEPKVNSSHHQAILEPGDNLRITAVSPADGVVEAVELDSPDHFVLGVQWHPERTFDQSAFSRALFSAFIEAVRAWQPPAVESLSRS